MTLRRMYLLCSIGLLLLGCGPKVMVPPKVDLARFVGIGLISFTSNSPGTLPIYVTQKFIETVTDAQPEAKIIEIASLDKVLDSFKSMNLAPKRYGLLESTIMLMRFLPAIW